MNSIALLIGCSRGVGKYINVKIFDKYHSEAQIAIVSAEQENLKVADD